MGKVRHFSVKSVETVTTTKKTYSYIPNWGNVFDDRGAGNTIIGTYVTLSIKRPNDSKSYSLSVINQLYCTEIIDENGRIIQSTDGWGILEESLMRGERE